MERTTALVAEDDPGVREYVRSCLDAQGIASVGAEDGVLAESQLRQRAFDLLFLDLDLPRQSGRDLLERIARGVLPRPGAIAVMSAPTQLADERGDFWAGFDIAGLLSKPFGRAELRAFVERTGRVSRLVGAAAEVAAYPVVTVGAGAWLDGLARMIVRCGGEILRLRSSDEACGGFHRRPVVAIVGPPLGAVEASVASARLRAAGAPAVLAASYAPVDLAADDAEGVDDTFHLPRGFQRMCSRVLTLAQLRRRSEPRRPLPIELRLEGADDVAAEAVDLSDEGIGVRLRAPMFVGETVTLQVPVGDPRVAAHCTVAWRRDEPGGWTRAGLRFTALDDASISRIRAWLAGAPGAR